MHRQNKFLMHMNHVFSSCSVSLAFSYFLALFSTTTSSLLLTSSTSTVVPELEPTLWRCHATSRTKTSLISPIFTFKFPAGLSFWVIMSFGCRNCQEISILFYQAMTATAACHNHSKLCQSKNIKVKIPIFVLTFCPLKFFFLLEKWSFDFLLNKLR